MKLLFYVLILILCFVVIASKVDYKNKKECQCTCSGNQNRRKIGVPIRKFKSSKQTSSKSKSTTKTKFSRARLRKRIRKVLKAARDLKIEIGKFKKPAPQLKNGMTKHKGHRAGKGQRLFIPGLCDNCNVCVGGKKPQEPQQPQQQPKAHRQLQMLPTSVSANALTSIFNRNE